MLRRQRRFASESNLFGSQHQHAWHDGPFWYRCLIKGRDRFFDLDCFDHACNLCDRNGNHLSILVAITTSIALVLIRVLIADMAIVVELIIMIVVSIAMVAFVAIT